MTIAVIGANGRSGQVFVELALAAGHQVRAGARGKSRFAAHPNLVTMECDATNEVQVAELISGQDAVVSLIGHVRKSPATVQTNAMRVLIGMMEKAGVSRVVTLTGTGVRYPGDQITLMDRLLNMGVSLVDPARVKDGTAACRLLENSSLKWTIIRVLKLTEQNPGAFKLREHGPAKSFVPRGEVAQAILSVLVEDALINSAPIISSPQQGHV
ncbi:MAG: NAD(P)H-binding protein [bacterium]